MKVLLSLVLLGVAYSALGEKVRYDNYKVYRFTPQNEVERQYLLDLQENNPGLMFWKQVRPINMPTDIAVPPHLQPMIEEGFRPLGMDMKVMINDIQSLIDVEALAQPGPFLTWDAYYGYNDIVAFLTQMAQAHPSIVRHLSYGTSFEGRDLRYVILNKGNTRKPIIWVDANIHAREWITNTMATYLINDLLNGNANRWLDQFNFYILPCANPDGYEYSRNTDRMWRKTRTNYASGTTCRGADPNRNFPFDWNTGGSSALPCSDTFMGVRAASEPEVQAIIDLYATIASETVVYLSLHSYSQLELISYGTARGRIPDHNRHMTVGNAIAAAIRRRYNTNFTPGNIVDLLYVASGGSGDHVIGTHGVDLAYTFEMRDTGRYGFLLPADQIIPSALEFMDGVDVLLENARKTIP